MGTRHDHIRALEKKCLAVTFLGLAATLLFFGAIWERINPGAGFPFLEHGATIGFFFYLYPGFILPLSCIVVAIFRPRNEVHAFALAFSVSGGMLLPLPIWVQLLEPQPFGELLGHFVTMFSFMLLTGFLIAFFTFCLQAILRRKSPTSL